MITSALTTEIATLTADPRVLVAGHFGPSWADAVTPDMSVHDIEQKHLPRELAPYFKRHDIPAKNWGAEEVLRDRKTRELVADLTVENLKNPSHGMAIAQVAFKGYQQPLVERWLEVRKEASQESGLLAATRRAQVFWSAANQARQIAGEVEEGTLDEPTRRWLAPLLHKYGYAPKAKRAAISPEDRAVQVVRELTKDAIVQRQADQMPKDHKELSRLEDDDDFRKVVVEVAKNHITEPEARRFKVSVGNVFDRAIDYWQEADIDPQDKKGREVAKNKLSNLYAATNLVLNYRHTQLPEWLRLALNERDLSHRTAMEHPSEQANDGDPLLALARMGTDQEAWSTDAQGTTRARAARLPFHAQPAGTHVVVRANPISRRMYSDLPPDGTVGVVKPVAMPGGKRTYLPGPGGGLLYVEFPDGVFMGVSPIDLDKQGAAPEPSRKEAAQAVTFSPETTAFRAQHQRVRVAKTLDADRQRILDHLRQERWEVDTDSDPPFATTPDGVTRVWLEPRGTYVVHGRNPDDLVRDEARSLGLGDLGKVSGPSFVYEVGEWVRDSTRDGGVTRDRIEPTIGKSASTSLPSGTPSDEIHATLAPAVLHRYLKKDLPAIRNITDRELERDRVVREVIAETIKMPPAEQQKLYAAAFQYNVDLSRRSMDLNSKDPESQKALRQAYALKMAFVYAIHAREHLMNTPSSKRPTWLRAMP